MASTTDNGSEWSWSSWISSAKEKSMAALSATTRDLAEFVNVVQEDTTKVASDAANKVKQIINKEEEPTEDTTDNKDQSPTVNADQGETSHPSYDRAVAHLEVLRSDPNTYCTVPEGKGGDFLEWSRDFDLSTQQDEISRLLVVSVNIRKLHSALVPAKVSYESFWFNYFYRVHLLNEQEAHRAQIMSRVHSQGQLICWDDEELESDRREENVIIVKREGSEDGRAMTDSSESFVCINDDDAIKDLTHADDGLVINNQEGEGIVINDQRDKDVASRNNQSDDDWENWNDN